MIVPAPMLTFSPIVASPRYDRWFAFDPLPERRLLQLDEVADVRVFADVRLRPDVRERPDRARPRATCDSVITQ